MLKMLLFAGIGVAVLNAAPLTKGERQRLVAHFEMTDRWLGQELAGLSQAQLQFRSAEDKWSILDVLEHLVIAEPQYWHDFQEAMKRPPSDKKLQATDADVLWYGIDRTRRATTAPERTSKHELKDSAKGLDAFRKLRLEMLRFARTSEEDLRGHIWEQWGVDCYQGLLEISTHSMRHLLQIQEVKADPKFPRS